MTEEVKNEAAPEAAPEVNPSTGSGQGEEAPVETPAEAPAEAEETNADVEARLNDEVGQVPAKFKELVETVEGLSVLELHELVKLLEKKFDVSAQAVAVAAPGTGGDEAEEKSSFDVELTSIGDSKISVIKAIKEVLGLGLKEAKDMTEGAPIVVKAGAKKEEAEELKAKLEEAGASVTLK
ncbi:50S ribosomal protein L7/L12 [Candidatus Wolfebacteria bacterium]|nr:MAG: 50S ribosomal protein L7/L12 [Candidatus Wolfebacteria bacterium]